jgi:hypothetical protein
MTQADTIRKFVYDRLIIPAEQSGQLIVKLRAGDIHLAMNLKNRMPAICSAIDAQKFQDFANVTLVSRSEPN